MFNSIRGTITHKGDNLLFLATQGIEWEIHTTATSLEALPAAGGEAALYVHLLHREDQMRLYGFATPDERALFLEIVKVDGVGPRLAQKILSAINRSDFLSVVEREDLAALEALPGLGKKTAQKIVLNLKGKLPVSGAADEEGALLDDLVNALAGMGFDKKASREAVVRVMKETEGARSGTLREREQEIFKRALAQVSREGTRR